MLSFKEFILEAYSPDEIKKLVAKKDCKPFVKSSGIQSLISPHANFRESEREIGSDVLEELVKKSLDYIASKPAEAGKTNEVLYYSTKLKQAFIGSYRKDLNGNSSDKEKYLFIVTILPKGKNFARADTHKVTLKEAKEVFDVDVDSVVILD